MCRLLSESSITVRVSGVYATTRINLCYLVTFTGAFVKLFASRLVLQDPVLMQYI